MSTLKVRRVDFGDCEPPQPPKSCAGFYTFVRR